MMNTTTKRFALQALNASSLAVLIVSSIALANTRTFKIIGTQNLATVQSDTTVENFVGRTSKVTGELRFDSSAKTGSGVIVVDGSSIQTGNGTRDQHMRSPDWMNFDKHRDIRFETSKVTYTKDDQYSVIGKLSLSGQTKDLTTTATVRFLPASEQTKQLGFSGDVVNLRTQFNIKLSDFGVKIPSRSATSVSDVQRIQINVFASSQ
jgi:polyisoprenoid-binding protein YceI